MMNSDCIWWHKLQASLSHKAQFSSMEEKTFITRFTIQRKNKDTIAETAGCKAESEDADKGRLYSSLLSTAYFWTSLSDQKCCPQRRTHHLPHPAGLCNAQHSLCYSNPAKDGLLRSPCLSDLCAFPSGLRCARSCSLTLFCPCGYCSRRERSGVEGGGHSSESLEFRSWISEQFDSLGKVIYNYSKGAKQLTTCIKP